MKHVHFIGICGTAMAPLAAAFQRNGWRVTGSDKGIFPPMSDYLRGAGVSFYVGFHPDHIGNPDLAVVGNFIGPSNAEFISVRERKVAYASYPEVLSKYLIRKKSIVVVGTYGKTMTTALLAWIWETAGRKPTYMAAGILNNFPDPVRMQESDWSIVEGDEYPASRWRPAPKFDFYHPHFLLLTGAEWDHVDVYPTEEKYLEVFKKLIQSVPKDGIIVAASDRPHVSKLVKDASARIIRYGRAGDGNASWRLLVHARDGKRTELSFHGPANEKIGPLASQVLGDKNLDHFAGAVALARACGVDADNVAKALTTFKGVRRRMEIRGAVNDVSVIDDFAHSPTKASATLHALRLHFPHAKIIAVFEPNLGNRVKKAAPAYERAFKDADIVIIPRLSVVKIKKGVEPPYDGAALRNLIASSHPQPEIIYIENDEELIENLVQKAGHGDCIVFLGSHGFRGMIEQTLVRLQ